MTVNDKLRKKGWTINETTEGDTIHTAYIPPIVFKPITEPNMHGVEAYSGNRKAMVVRVDSCCGTWTCFKYIDGQIVHHPGKFQDVSKADATKEAKTFLKGSPIVYVIMRMSDYKYVAPPGQELSYTAKLEEAQTFKSRETATPNCCQENEKVVPIEELLHKPV